MSTMSSHYFKRTFVLLVMSVLILSCRHNDRIFGSYTSKLAQKQGYVSDVTFQLTIMEDSTVILETLRDNTYFFTRLYKLTRTDDNTYKLFHIGKTDTIDFNNVPIRINKIKHAVTHNDNATILFADFSPYYEWTMSYDDTSCVFCDHEKKEINYRGGECRIVGVWKNGDIAVRRDTIQSETFILEEPNSRYSIALDSMPWYCLLSEEARDDVLSFVTPTIIQLKRPMLTMKKNEWRKASSLIDVSFSKYDKSKDRFYSDYKDYIDGNNVFNIKSIRTIMFVDDSIVEDGFGRIIYGDVSAFCDSIDFMYVAYQIMMDKGKYNKMKQYFIQKQKET
ncbi:MAG: hypothetical protein II670_01795, partial [Alphaproteobacteria bacterium]|nr:hypothetical protein [Alphaproteobacteria bacterium]